MRLAVLDTNVIVSAGLKLDSVPYRLVMDWVLAGQVQAVTCAAVIREADSINPRPKESAVYAEAYATYRALYPALCSVFDGSHMRPVAGLL